MNDERCRQEGGKGKRDEGEEEEEEEEGREHRCSLTPTL